MRGMPLSCLKFNFRPELNKLLGMTAAMAMEDKTRIQRERFHFVFRVSTYLSFASSCEVEECLKLFIGRLAALVSLVL